MYFFILFIFFIFFIYIDMIKMKKMKNLIVGHISFLLGVGMGGDILN